MQLTQLLMLTGLPVKDGHFCGVYTALTTYLCFFQSEYNHTYMSISQLSEHTAPSTRFSLQPLPITAFSLLIQ